jgi:hypothetical protein
MARVPLRERIAGASRAALLVAFTITHLVEA